MPGLRAQRSEYYYRRWPNTRRAMRALGINGLRTCDWALREVLSIHRLRELEAESRPPGPDFADPKSRGVHEVGRRFGYEEGDSHQVARLAEVIFDSLADAENLTHHQRSLMSAAALLHEVGYHFASESHHKHSLYLIQNSELTGFSEAERVVIANVARYHHGLPPKDRHLEYGVLNPADRETVLKLGAIVRLADALDRSHEGRVVDLRCSRNVHGLQIQVRSPSDCESELLQAERKRHV